MAEWQSNNPFTTNTGVRRMHTFCRNRRSLISLCILGLLFVMAIGAGFIANDKPIIVQFNGKIMIPILREYPETVFGGVFETEALYRDPSVQSLIKADGWMFWPPVRYRHDTISLNQDGSFPSSPNREHPLGTDEVGRDVFARVLYGYRISVFFGICLALVSTVIGVLVGAFLGYRGGLYDIIGQRFIEIWSGMPLTYIMIIVSSIMLPGFFLLLGVMLLFSWMGLVDVVRAEFLRCRNLEYVEAAKVLGVRDRTIILRHILPNALVATATYIPFVINGSIVSLTSLDFLGLGLSSNYPSLGDLLAQGRAYMDAPWIGLSALTVLVLQLTLLVFIGEGIRDALDSYREETR